MPFFYFSNYERANSRRWWLNGLRISSHLTNHSGQFAIRVVRQRSERSERKKRKWWLFCVFTGWARTIIMPYNSPWSEIAREPPCSQWSLSHSFSLRVQSGTVGLSHRGEDLRNAKIEMHLGTVVCPSVQLCTISDKHSPDCKIEDIGFQFFRTL